MKLEIITIQEGFDGVTCWTQSRIGIMPGLYVLNTQKLRLAGSDVYSLVNSRYSRDEGKTWSELLPQGALSLPGRSIADTVPFFHQATGKMVMTGQAIPYKDDTALHPDFDAPAHAYTAVYDASAMRWTHPQRPLNADGRILENVYFGCIQTAELAGGDLLVPFVRKVPATGKERINHVVVGRFSFDGERLRLKDLGNELHADEEPRGVCEPSLIAHNGVYYLTVRSDNKGWITTSRDGIHFSELTPWLWDTGLPVPTYNTQSHWVRGGGGLHLVYTRKDGKNDHVFRNRAPLYMARVDTENLRLERNTEIAVTPERGARMGNFGTNSISDAESLVVSTEWMQPVGCEKFGSNNAIYMTRISWE